MSRFEFIIGVGNARSVGLISDGGGGVVLVVVVGGGVFGVGGGDGGQGKARPPGILLSGRCI